MTIQNQIRLPLWEAISKPYESRIYKAAILDAIHYLSDVIRDKANVDGDGVSLVGQAFSGDSPRIRINKFQTDSEKNEQRGFEQIIRGIYQGIRNPRSHEQFEDTKETADAIIIFINYVLGVVDKSKGPFVLEEWIERVFDPDFAESDRYAKLLLDEVPPKKYMDVIIEIYRKKLDGNVNKLKYMFKHLFEAIGDEKIDDFLSVVSDELRITKDERSIMITLRVLPSEYWPKISEISRLRIESKLINSVKGGVYGHDYIVIENETIDHPDKTIKSGHLGIYIRLVIDYITLKKDLAEAVREKIVENNDEGKEYIAKYFFSYLPKILKENDFYRTICIDAISGDIVNRKSPFDDVLISHFHAFPEDWQQSFIERLKPLERTAPEYYDQLTNELPF
jgi:uncharacterized protein (TIGR02391 family)